MALGAAQVLQQVGQLTRPQPLQAVLRRLQRAARPVLRAEAGDAGPVDDPIRGRPGPEPRRAEPPQQAAEPDVHADQLHHPGHPGQVQVRGADDPRAVGIDKLVIDDIARQLDLAGPARDVPQVQPRRTQPDKVAAEFLHRIDRQPRPAPPHPRDQPGHRRVRLVAVPPGHNVRHLADLLPGLVDHRLADQPGQAHQLAADMPQRRQALDAPLIASPQRRHRGGRRTHGHVLSHVPR